MTDLEKSKVRLFLKFTRMKLLGLETQVADLRQQVEDWVAELEEEEGTDADTKSVGR